MAFGQILVNGFLVNGILINADVLVSVHSVLCVNQTKNMKQFMDHQLLPSLTLSTEGKSDGQFHGNRTIVIWTIKLLGAER